MHDTLISKEESNNFDELELTIILKSVDQSDIKITLKRQMYINKNFSAIKKLQDCPIVKKILMKHTRDICRELTAVMVKFNSDS